jgi:SAM-dependent methyltransferase
MMANIPVEAFGARRAGDRRWFVGRGYGFDVPPHRGGVYPARAAGVAASPEEAERKSMPDTTMYDSYVAFKQWGDTAALDRPEDFEYLLRDAGLTGSKLDILDFGFGAGDFMDWARGAGHSIVGVEILPEMIAAAAARGHRVLAASDAEAGLGDARFDAVVTLDVMEHLDRNAFAALIALARMVLKPGGIILARFPNGDSPFFGRFQYGDLTHDKPLSASSVRQWAAPHGMVLTRAFNPRSIPPGLGRSLKRRLTYLARNLIETLLGFVYFGYRFPMDPNVAVVLKRTEEAPDPKG